MADDPKKEANLDDWDSMPLDQTADDWDDIPPPKPLAQPADSPEPEPPPPPTAAPPVDSATIAALLGQTEPPADEVEAPEASEDTAPPAEEAQAPAAASPEPSDDFDDDLDSSDPPLDAAATVVTTPAREPEDDQPQDNEAADMLAGLDFGTPNPDKAEVVELGLEDISGAGKNKVELDDEGLDDLNEPEPESEPEPEPKPEAEPEPPAPAVPPPAALKKIPKSKLLVLAGGGAVVLIIFSFGAYKLFFSASPPPSPAPAVLVIDPHFTKREPAPGAIELKPFYLNFQDNSGETLVEMNVTLYYKDIPDQLLLTDNLPKVRDIILQVTLDQGSQAVSSGDVQRALRQAAADQINRALGHDSIDYVQISQIRILQ